MLLPKVFRDRKISKDFEAYDEFGEFDYNKFFKPVYLNNLLEKNFEAPLWIVEKLIPAEAITIISGAPKSYKSFISLYLALCISQGKKAFEQYDCKNNGIIIVDEENHERFIKERVKKLGAIENLGISFISQKGFSLTNDDHIDGLIGICEEREAKVVILDSLVRLHDLEENSSKDIAKVFAQIKRLCENKLTVIILHHERKEGAHNSAAPVRMRGSSDISAAVDSHIAIKKDPDDENKIIVEHAQCRCAREEGSFALEIIETEDNMWFEFKGKLDSKKESAYKKAKDAIPVVLQGYAAGILRGDLTKEIKTKSNVGMKVVRWAINALIEDGIIEEVQGRGNQKLIRPKESK
ncbi:MAG: AAA family ATPase [Parcubacteria group bacterium]|jgi:archaellum biogenesis ATPase FlaH